MVHDNNGNNELVIGPNNNVFIKTLYLLLPDPKKMYGYLCVMC